MENEQLLRKVLNELETSGELMHCEVQVNPKFEIGAILDYYKSQKPILFENVRGSSSRVAGGLYGNRNIVMQLLHTNTADRIPRILSALKNPVKPCFINSGPAQENVVTSGIDLLKLLPVPTYNEKDSRPFLTSAMLVYKDPKNGRTYLAVRRFQINSGNSLNVLVSPASPYLRNVLYECEKEKKDLECAVIIGSDVSLFLTSQTSTSRYETDKYEIDSALRGEPLKLIHCLTVDLDVPAQSEFVMEGVIHPGKKGMEGPFAELMGYYSLPEDSPLIEVNAVTYRDDAILQQCFPGKEEHLAYGMIKEAEIFEALRNVVDVQDVNLTTGGGHRLHAVVSIRSHQSGDGKSAILTTLGSYKDIKHVIVVDDDVDIYSAEEVEAAIASRFQASEDIVEVDAAKGSPLEPSYHERGMSDKLGFDATVPYGKGDAYRKAVIPGFDSSFDIHRYFH